MKNEIKIRKEIDSLEEQLDVIYNELIKKHYDEFIDLAGIYEELAKLHDQLDEFEDSETYFHRFSDIMELID